MSEKLPRGVIQEWGKGRSRVRSSPPPILRRPSEPKQPLAPLEYNLEPTQYTLSGPRVS